MSRIFFATIACGVLVSISGFAQEDYTSYKSDAAVQGIGSFVKSTTENGRRNKARPTAAEYLPLTATISIATTVSR